MGLDVKTIADINDKIKYRMLSLMRMMAKVSATGLPLPH